MIEVKYVVPFDTYDRRGYGVSFREINKEKLQGSLWKNRWFIEDLNDYFHKSDAYKVKAIIPWGVESDNAGYYVDFRVYSDAETLSDTDIDAITDYIKGQVSDGWGENGFDIFDDMTICFDYDNVVHNGFRFITDKEFGDIIDVFKGRQIKAINESEISKKFVESPSNENLHAMIDEVIEKLLKLSGKLKEYNEG